MELVIHGVRHRSIIEVRPSLVKRAFRGLRNCLRRYGRWSSIGIWGAYRPKSGSIVKMGNLRLTALAQIKKSMGEPWMPFDLQALKNRAAEGEQEGVTSDR